MIRQRPRRERARGSIAQHHAADERGAVLRTRGALYLRVVGLGQGLRDGRLQSAVVGQEQ